MQNYEDKSLKTQPIEPTDFVVDVDFNKYKLKSKNVSLDRNKLYYYCGCLTLILGLVVVFFVIPKLIDSNRVESGHIKTKKEIDYVSDKKNQPSPYRDAKITRQRQQIQEILQNILQLQEDLIERSVEKWGSEAYSHAHTLNEQADSDYKKREFELALHKYEQALSALRDLRESIPAKIESYLAKGSIALNTGDVISAHESFDRVLVISSNHPRGLTGKERAHLLQQAWEYMIQGEQYFEEYSLSKAHESLTLSLTIDPLTEPAAKLLTQVKIAIKERDYKQAMSSGYAALANNEFSKAEELFFRAQKLKPKEVDPLTGLAHAKSALSQEKVEKIFSRANKMEKQEKWYLAAESYRKLLNLDPSLVLAITGKARTEARQKIDDKLTELLKDPLSLNQNSRFTYAQKVLFDAQALKAGTPKIEGQIKQLQTAIRQSLKPIAVYLRSDEITEVVIFHIGKFGSFKEREIKIKPGRYTAIGTRKGYRDVRKKFVINPSDTEVVISIRCEEEIPSTREG